MFIKVRVYVHAHRSESSQMTLRLELQEVVNTEKGCWEPNMGSLQLEYMHSSFETSVYLCFSDS